MANSIMNEYFTDGTSRPSHLSIPQSRQESSSRDRGDDDCHQPRTKLAAQDKNEEQREDECLFEILYFREFNGSSTRSFEDFSCSDGHNSGDCTLEDSLGDFGFDLHEDDTNNDKSKEEHEACKELMRKIKKTRKALKKEKQTMVAEDKEKTKKKSTRKIQKKGASMPSSTFPAAEEEEPRTPRSVRKNQPSPLHGNDDCRGNHEDSRPPRRPDHMSKMKNDNIHIVNNRSATNRSEMSQLIKALGKDRERADRDREIALRLKHEMETLDIILAEKTGGAKETFAACSETMSEVQYLLSKTTVRILQRSASPPGKSMFSRAA